MPPKKKISPAMIEIGTLIVFCSIFWFQAWQHARSASAIYDETTHLPSGYSYLMWQDYRMNPEHPPLVKKLAAISLLWGQTWPPTAELKEDDRVGETPASLLRIKRGWALALVSYEHLNRVQWFFGHEMLYGLRDEVLDRVKVADPTLVPPTSPLRRSDFLNDADCLLMQGRISIIGLGTLLAILVFYWTKEMFGFAGGVLALTLFAFDPSFIAHSSLVTTDVGVTLFMFASLYFLWRTCRRLNVADVAMTSLAVALAFATKYSAVLLLPVFLLIGVARVFSANDWLVGTSVRLARRGAKTLAVLGLLLACCVVTYGMIWATYSFRYSAVANPVQSARDGKIGLFQAALAEAGVTIRRENSESLYAYVERLARKLEEVAPQVAATLQSNFYGELPIDIVVGRSAAINALLKDWDWQARPDGPVKSEVEGLMASMPPSVVGKIVLFAKRKKLIPEAYLYGFASAEMHALGRSSFIAGNYSMHGFWYYFPAAFFMKTPILTMLGIAFGIFFAIRSKLPWSSQTAFIVIPVGVYLLFSIGSNLNIGHRHLLPIYPFLFVLAGANVIEWNKWSLPTKWWSGPVIIGVIILNTQVVFAPPWRPAPIHPHFLSYFNEFAGGPRNGHKLLVDSNLDWGQDLKGLKGWMEANRIEEINLAYFGMADPRYYQIVHLNMPWSYPFEPSEKFDQKPDGSIVFPNIRSPYLAISATHLEGVYLPRRARNFWKEVIKNATLVGTIGYSIFIYRLEPTR